MVGWISRRDFPEFEISLKQAVLADDDDDDDGDDAAADDDDDDDDDVFFPKKHFTGVVSCGTHIYHEGISAPETPQSYKHSPIILSKLLARICYRNLMHGYKVGPLPVINGVVTPINGLIIR